jgi:hypothetical protein
VSVAAALPLVVIAIVLALVVGLIVARNRAGRGGPG